MKRVKNCIICGQQANMRTVGHSNVLIFCWKHDVAAKRHWDTDYHLAPKKIKEEIRNMSTNKLSKIFKVSL